MSLKNLFGGGGGGAGVVPVIAPPTTSIAPPTPVDAGMEAGGVNQRRAASAAADRTLRTGPRGLQLPYSSKGRKTLLGE